MAPFSWLMGLVLWWAGAGVRRSCSGGLFVGGAVTTARAPTLLFAGLPVAPAPASPFGTLWLDPSASIVLAFGIAAGDGVVGGQLPLPSALPPGLTVCVQAVADLGAGLEVSSPALGVVR